MQVGNTYLVRNLNTLEIKLLTFRRQMGAYIEMVDGITPVWYNGLEFALGFEVLESMGVDTKNIYNLFDIHAREAEKIFKIPEGELCKKVRGRRYVDARKCVMYVLRHRYRFSLNEIAMVMKWSDGTETDHSTVIHAVQRAENFILTDKEFKANLESIYNLTTNESKESTRAERVLDGE